MRSVVVSSLQQKPEHALELLSAAFDNAMRLKNTLAGSQKVLPARSLSLVVFESQAIAYS